MKPKRTNPLFARFFRAGLTSLIVVSSAAFAADSISINFGAGNAVDEAGKVTGAIPIDGTLWNNPGSNNGTDVSVNDSAGNPVATVSWTSNNIWNSGSTGSTGTSENGDLYKNYLDDGGGVTIDLITPYLIQDVYLFPGTDQGDPANISAMSINGAFYKGDGAGATIAAGSGDSWSAQNWTASDTLVESTNYIKALGQAGVSISSLQSSPGRASIAGIQVENAYFGTFSYWDTNDATAGSGDAGGTWGTDTFWSSSADGDIATGAWSSGDAAVFSAGTDGTGFNTVTIDGTQAADAVWVQEGEITLDGGILDLSAGLGILRGDDQGLFVNSEISAANLTTAGYVVLGNASNTVTGLATIGGLTDLGADHSFPQLAGGGTLWIDSYTLTVGDATDSTFGGTFDGTGAIDKVGTGTLTLGSVSDVYGGTFTVSAGTLDMAGGGSLFWDVSGAGSFAKSGGSQLTVQSDITTTAGTLNISGGIMQLGDVSDVGSIPASASIAITNGALLRYRHDTLADTITGPVTLDENSQIRQHAGTTGTLTVSGNITGLTSDANGNAVDGRLSTEGGDLVFASGTTSAVREVYLKNGNVTVETGADLTLRYLNIGNGTNSSGIVTQTGGTVTVQPGSNGVRIGHWGGAGRAYNISGGTFDASGVASNGGDARYITAGWDGEGDMTIGGGAGTATVKCVGLIFDRNRGGTGSSASTATLLTDGVLEIGSLGIAGQGDNDGLVMSGGLVRGTASSTWNTPMVTTTATSSTIDIGGGNSVTYSKPISGDGALSKTGAGTLALTSGASTYTGALSVDGGALQVDTTFTGAVTVTSGAGIATGASGFGSVDTLTLAAGSSSNFAIGGGTADNLAATGLDGLTVSTAHTINVQPTGELVALDQFPLFTYSGTLQGDGFAGFTLTPLSNPHYGLSLVDNAGLSVDLKVDTVTPVVWTGPGTAWNLTDPNWDDGAASNFYDADIAVFNDLTATESVVVDTLGGTAPIAPAAMTFNNTTATTYTVSGDAISGPGGLTKTGDGTLIITNDNTYTGLTDVQAGILQIGDGGTSGSVAGNIAVDATASLDFRRSDAFSVTANGGQTISGAGPFTFDGGGTGEMTLAGRNSNTGGLTIDNGTVILSGGGWYQNPSQGLGMMTVLAGGTAVNWNSHSYGGSYAPNVDMTLDGGTFQVRNGTYVRDIWMTGATIENYPGSDSQIQTRGGGGTDVIVEDSATQSVISCTYFTGEGASTITVNDPDTDFLISGQITGNDPITKNGVGTLLSTGANTHDSAININEGTVVFTGDNSARTGGTAMNGTTFTTSSVSAAAIGTGFIALKDGTLVYEGTGAETTTQLLWIDQGTGTIDVTNGAATLTLNPSGGTVNRPVIKDGPGRLRMQGALTGAASVTVNGGRMDLDGANSYTGETTVNDTGLVYMSVANLDDASTVNLNDTGKLNLDHGGTDVIAALNINGAPQAAGMTYGSTSSGADVQDDTHFSGNGVLEIPSTFVDYDDWMAQYTSITLPADKLPTADPDGDGLTNSEEFAFGLDPSSGSSVNPIVTGLDQSTGTFTYQRLANSGLTYTVSTSTTLDAWTEDAGISESVTPVGDNEEVTVTLSAIPTDPTFFVRVSAE